MNSQTKELSYSSLNEELLQQPLFKAKSWQLSSQTFKLEKRQEQHLALIGVAIHSLLSALRQLYLQARSSYSDEYNWVRDYLERGKPEWICQLSQDTRFTPQMLSVMRPDIILTNTGYALTEIDSLPGGIGLTELLYQTYTKDTSNTSPFTLLEEFHAALARLRPDKENPVVIIIYNDEGETYWPEFDWIAAQLRSNGKKVYTSHVKDITCDTNTVSFNHNGEQMTADVIYRFFELFDDSSKNLIQGIAAVMNHSNLAIT